MERNKKQTDGIRRRPGADHTRFKNAPQNELSPVSRIKPALPEKEESAGLARETEHPIPEKHAPWAAAPLLPPPPPSREYPRPNVPEKEKSVFLATGRNETFPKFPEKSSEKQEGSKTEPREIPDSHVSGPPAHDSQKPVFPSISKQFGLGARAGHTPGEEQKSRSMLYREEERSEKNISGDSRHRMLWLGTLAAFTVIAAGAFVLSTRFNRMNVIVKMKRENMLLQDVGVTIDGNVSEALAEKGVIPAEYLTFSKTAQEEFSSSGHAKVEEKSNGRAKIYNAFSSAPQTLIAGTRFTADAGNVYRIARAITVPGAEIADGKIIPRFVEADLFADKPGEEFNASGELTLRIAGFQGTPKYDAFYAIASSGFSGGFKGETAVVLDMDIARAEETVTKKAYDALEDDVRRGIPPGFTFADGLKEIEILKLGVPAEKTPGERFSVHADAEARILVFRQEDVMRFLGAVLLKGDASRELAPKGVEMSYRVRMADFKKKQASLALQGNVKAQRTLNPKELSQALAGKKEGTLLNFLKTRDEFSTFRLSFFPPWLFSAPSDPSKIRFIVEGE